MIELKCDVMVIGAGHAGMAAALFAAQRGLSVVQAGTTGGIDFGSGFIDVLGVHPVAEKKELDDPWPGVASLRAESSEHPYARLNRDDITDGINAFTDFLTAQGLAFQGNEGRNLRLPTPAGTTKRTYLAPATMAPGATALREKAPCLIVSFDGLKGFSGRQLTETLGKNWPALRSAIIKFPGLDGELYPEHMANALGDPARRKALAETVRPHLGDARYAGFPAMLGVLDCAEVTRHMEELLGVTVFEIPTLPPPIMGVRLRAAFDRGLHGLGVRTLSQKTVMTARPSPDGFRFRAGGAREEYAISARAAVLATGRFFGKGIRQQTHDMRETVFDLPVARPADPDDWYDDVFFSQNGHPADRCGVLFDDDFRPLNDDGTPFHHKLHAAGAILSGHDWIREKSGTGLAVGTAWKAVNTLAKSLGGAG